jgi:AraC-like DNA-binding protein
MPSIQTDPVNERLNMLRATARPLAQAALEAGYCDQSHIYREMQRVLGRTPQAIWASASDLRSATQKSSNILGWRRSNSVPTRAGRCGG